MKVIKVLIVVIALVFSKMSLIAQTDITIGKIHTLTSKILNQERELQIYLPNGHETSDKEFPVLYILDGQWHFTNGVAIQKSLRVPDRLPEMIVVGIKNKNPLRRSLFWGEKEKFLSHLEKEVFPYIEKNFKASHERILFGWEAGGYFASYALFNKKQLFNAAIVTNGAYASEDEINTFDNLNLSKSKFLYISNSTKDIYSITASDSFSQLLTKKSPRALKWKYQLFNDEIHESLAYLALYHGLNYYFYNYQSLVFGDIQEYNTLGGISYLKAYHKERGERYGFSPEIDNATKDGLIWLAWNRDDFESFKFFMTEFVDVLSTPRYASAYWQNRFGQFYLKHNDHENAIHYFNNGINTYPESGRLAEMYAGLGDAHLKNKDRNKARRNYKKAIQMAEKNSDSNLPTYKRKLLNQKK